MKCEKCPELVKSRKMIVTGYGSGINKLMIVGEAPSQVGGNLTGEPFTGNSGKWLFSIFSSFGIKKEDCYITNIVKCSPAGNRQPTLFEIRNCSPYLAEEIRAIQPKIILCLGEIACMALNPQLWANRGTFIKQNKTQLIGLSHPSYILRQNLSFLETYKQDISKICGWLQ